MTMLKWPMQNRRARAAGIGLAEVMICLAIMGVLAAYAIPSYRRHVMRAYRVDAVSALYRAAHAIEQQQADGQAQREPVLPATLAQAPQSGQAMYRLTLAAATAENGGYALEASPLAGGPMQADRVCGSFVLDASGRRANRVDGTLLTERVPTCWDGRSGAA